MFFTSHTKTLYPLLISHVNSSTLTCPLCHGIKGGSALTFHVKDKGSFFILSSFYV